MLGRATTSIRSQLRLEQVLNNRSRYREGVSVKLRSILSCVANCFLIAVIAASAGVAAFAQAGETSVNLGLADVLGKKQSTVSVTISSARTLDKIAVVTGG